MPRGRRFVFRKKRNVPVQVHQQSCVVCYTSFHPFPVSQTKWESSLTKVFYKALSIPPFQTGEEEGDEVLLLPYCPDCHSKISVLFNLYSQLEQLQNQYACVRNEIAFTVVETIGKNCKNGPMDFIRQQICDKWQEFYADESSKEDFRDYFGLDALAATSQIELQDIYDSMFQESQDITMEEEDSFVDEDSLNKSENSDFQNYSSIDAGDVGTLPVGGSRKRTKRGAATRSFEEQVPVNGEDQLNDLGSMDGETKVGINPSFKMPRLIPMNPKSKVQKALVNKKFKGRRGSRGRGKGSRYQIQVEQFYNNHTGDVYDYVDESLPATTSAQEDVDIKPSLNSLKKKAMSHLNSKRYNPSKQSAKSSVVRYPTRNSGRTRKDPIDETGPERDSASTKDNVNLVSTANSGNEPSAACTTPAGVFSCTLCPKFYTTSSRLLYHESLCHPSLKSFHCDTCAKGFSSRLTYRRHMMNVHGESIPTVDPDRILQCPVCAKTFLKEYSLQLHMESHVETASASMKGKVSRRSSSTPKPKGKPRGRSVAMKKARELEQARESLSNGEVPDESPPATPLKKNSFSSPEKSRTDSVSEAGDDDLKCRICHKVFPYRTLLNMHFITHAKKNYKCDICNSAFVSYTELKFHSDEVHRTKLLPCTVCGKGFTGAESLQRHFKIHDLKQERIETPETEESDALSMSIDDPSVEAPILPN